MDIVIVVLCAVIIALLVFLIVKKDKGTDYTDGFRNLGGMISDNVKNQNEAFSTGVKEQVKGVKEEVENIRKDNYESYKSIEGRLETFFDRTDKKLTENFKNFTESTEKSLKGINETVDKNLVEIKSSVDKELKDALDTRLKESFENVISQIGQVNKAIGEISGLANDVGSLKTVLANVKTKGIVGEIILGNLIREILSPAQYEENAVTKKGSSERVEFAVKIPCGEGNDFIYLPVDSKFPLESYRKIQDGINECDKAKAEDGRKELRANIKKFAKDISSKYIDPPHTTDFAIMFLPTEGLYAEVIELGLFEEIQRDCKVNIVGPSTFSALLNALQMGFKSYTISRRSTQVFQVLADVKKEFNNFAEALAVTQKKMGEASENLESLVGTRTRKLNGKLKEIDTIPVEE